MRLTNTYAVLDVETTITKYMGRKASPFSPENWIVAAGWKGGATPVYGSYYGEDTRGYEGLLSTILAGGPKLLAGFNIKFDLLHLLRNEKDYAVYQEWVAEGGLVWDGQLAEYLLSGMTQESHMLSLDEVAPRYGGDTKIDEVKALWEKGVNTHLIPRQLLMDYLTGREGRGGDILNTEAIMLGQLKAAREAGLLQNIRLNMGALLASVEMERNGLWVNKPLGLELAEKLTADIATMREAMQQYIPTDLPFEFNWGSPKQRSALIFGGNVKYQAREPILDEQGGQAYSKIKVQAAFETVGQQWVCNSDDDMQAVCARMEAAGEGSFDKYTGGQKKGQYKTKQLDVDDLSRPKSRIADFYYKLPGYTKPRKEWAGAEAGYYSTKADIIEELALTGIPFLETYGKLAAATKDLGTYYITPDEKNPGEFKGMLTLVGPDGIVHHGVNHTSTVTGRLSHSNPNMGNLPKESTSEVKRMFGSRFGDDGVIGVSDFKTLEIYCQAMLTGDTQLIADLRAGLDMHCKRLAQVENMPYEKVLLLSKGGIDPTTGEEIHAVHEWEVKRTDIKEFSFKRAYGAGAKAIAAGVKKAVDLVQSWIDADAALYSGIVAWNEKVARKVEASRLPTPLWIQHPLINTRINIHRGIYKAFDGSRYTFTESPSPDWMAKRGILQSFSPPDMKNYPVQGTGGLWMKAAMWLAVRIFYKYKNLGGLALLVNTVHDALYGDFHESVRRKAGVLMHASMLAASDLIEHLFGTTVPVPVPSDTGYGSSMYEHKSFEDRNAFESSANTVRTWMRAAYMDGYVPSYIKES